LRCASSHRRRQRKRQHARSEKHDRPPLHTQAELAQPAPRRLLAAAKSLLGRAMRRSAQMAAF
jgi:hypothetical protein